MSQPVTPARCFSTTSPPMRLTARAWNVRVTGVTVNEEQQAYVDSPETISLSPDG